MAKLNIEFLNSDSFQTRAVTLNRARFILNSMSNKVKEFNSYDNVTQTVDHVLIENGEDKVFEGTVV